MVYYFAVTLIAFTAERKTNDLASHLTTGQVATFYNVPEWRIRRIVDSLDCDIPRVGLYRMIPVTCCRLSRRNSKAR